MYLPRLLEKTLKNALKTFPAVIVTGPRQSGKTTLVRHVLGKSHRYVSLDELDIRQSAIEDPRGFLERNPAPLILDEIQNAPELLPYIKAKIDQKRTPGQWILTGSQQFTLMRNVSESLAGRVAILPLYSLTLSEINQTLRPSLDDAESFLQSLMRPKKMRDNLSISCGRWLLEGGYPQLLTHHKLSKNLWFSSYVQSYIDRDVRGNLRSSNINDFEKFLKLLASRTSQEMNYSILSREIGITVPTIKSWVSLLEASSLIYLLQPYHRNFGKRIIKSPKMYFMDTGLVSYLVGLQNETHLLDGPMAGALFETAVVTEFVKRFRAFIDPCSLYFWKSVDGFEVDFLVESAQRITPIEIKLSATINHAHLSSMRHWFDLSGKLSNNGLIISNSKQHGLIDSKIANCHFSRL